MPIDLFTALTSHPTNACSRDSAASETVRVTQTIYREADAAAREAKFVCRAAKWKTLPSPIGDISCASPGDDGIQQILFHAGREMVLVDYQAGHPATGDITEAARKVYALLPH